MLLPCRLASDCAYTHAAIDRRFLRRFLQREKKSLGGARIREIDLNYKVPGTTGKTYEVNPYGRPPRSSLEYSTTTKTHNSSTY